MYAEYLMMKMKQCRFLIANVSSFIDQRIGQNLFLPRTICDQCQNTGYIKCNSTNTSKGEICSKHIANLLNCSHKTAISVMADCPAIIMQNPLHIKQSLSILLQHCDMDNILKNPAVFLIRPRKIGERIKILQEIGATSITSDKISRFGKLMKQPMKVLMKGDIISSFGDIVNNMLVALSCPEEIASTLKGKISTNSIKFYTAKDIRITIIRNYLCWKLDCSHSTIRRIAMIYPPIFGRSCHTIKQTLEILINRYHFSESKICSNGFLLELYPDNLERILQSVPILAGMDIRDCVVRFPRILSMSPEQLLQTEKVVKENNYTDEQLIKCLSVYNLKPVTVQQRLEAIDNEEELAVRKFLPYILTAVHSHKLVLRHLKQQKENELMPISLYSLLRSSNYADPENITPSYSPTELFYYLALVFSKTKGEVREKIGEYASMKQGSLLNAKKVTEYLLDKEVTKEQLWHGLYIVLYSVDVVKEQFQKLPDYEELQPFDEWKINPNFVHLLLYYIEKESGFILGSPSAKCETIIQSQLEANVND